MTAATLTVSPLRWRLLNALSAAGGAKRAADLVDAQDAGTEDLIWLADNEMVITTWFGRTTRLDLVEHIAHHGSTVVIALRLSSRGRRTVAVPQNRVLRCLGAQPGRRAGLARVLADAGVGVDAVKPPCYRRLLAATVRATGDPLAGDDLDQLPARSVVLRLTDRGRQYLPFEDPRS